MKEATARTLTEGSRVCWDNNPKDGGTVMETGYNAVKVRWDDPSQGEVGVLYFTEMGNIGLLPANRKGATEADRAKVVDEIADDAGKLLGL